MRTQNGQNLLVWMVVFTIVTFTTLVLRFLAAHVQRRSLRLDDYFIIGAFASLLSLEGTTFWAINNGTGAHVTELDPAQMVVQLKLLLSAGITWTFGTVLCKLAVLRLYNQLFSTPKIRLVIYIFMALTASEAIIFIPIFFTRCSPVSGAWNLDPVVQAAQCRPITQQEFASVAINMALDLSVVLIPLPIVWQLQMPLRKKVFVSGMFSIGFIIVGVMAWRINSTVKTTKDPDWSEDLATTALQSHLEIWLGIIAANLPTLGPLKGRYIELVYKTCFFSWSPKSSSHPNSGRRHIRTFGGGCTGNSYKMDANTYNSIDAPIEITEVQHLNRAEGDTIKNHSVTPNVTEMRRGVDVHVDMDERNEIRAQDTL